MASRDPLAPIGCGPAPRHRRSGHLPKIAGCEINPPETSVKLHFSRWVRFHCTWRVLEKCRFTKALDGLISMSVLNLH